MQPVRDGPAAHVPLAVPHAALEDLLEAERLVIVIIIIISSSINVIIRMSMSVLVL